MLQILLIMLGKLGLICFDSERKKAGPHFENLTKFNFLTFVLFRISSEADAPILEFATKDLKYRTVQIAILFTDAFLHNSNFSTF